MTTKINLLDETSNVAGDSLLVVVVNPSNVATIDTNRITVNNFFESLGVSAGNNVTANISGNILSIAISSTPSFTKVKFSGFATPSNSSYVNATYTFAQGDMFVDTNSIYIAVSNTEIKKVDLSAL